MVNSASGPMLVRSRRARPILVRGPVERRAERWSITNTCGLLNAGAGPRHSTALRNLEIGRLVFANVDGAGCGGVAVSPGASHQVVGF